MNYEAINFRQEVQIIRRAVARPKVIAEMNDYQFKIVKLQGDFVWHGHKNTDETFIVLEGHTEDRLSGWRRPRVGWRNVRGSKGRRPQAVCRARGQIIAYRTARSAQYWR